MTKDGEEDDGLIVDSDEEYERQQQELLEAEKKKYGKKQRYQGRSVGGNQKDQLVLFMILFANTANNHVF